MAESHIVSGLTKKRAELLGQIEAHQKEIQRISEMLLHVDHTIKLFSPEFDLRSIKSKRTNQRNPFPHRISLNNRKACSWVICIISYTDKVLAFNDGNHINWNSEVVCRECAAVIYQASCRMNDLGLWEIPTVKSWWKAETKPMVFGGNWKPSIFMGRKLSVLC